MTRKLILSDILPPGYQAAENAGIVEGDVMAVWGCGPVGQFAIQSALLLGAGQVIAIDRVPERLAMAAAAGGTPVDDAEGDVVEMLKGLTGGRGPDACIDAVGMEAHGLGLLGAYDRSKQALGLQRGRPSTRG